MVFTQHIQEAILSLPGANLSCELVQGHLFSRQRLQVWKGLSDNAIDVTMNMLLVNIYLSIFTSKESAFGLGKAQDY